MLKKISIILITVLLLLGLSGYVNADTPFSIDENNVDVKLNGTKYISYNGGTGNVTWTSGDTSIATVENGLVRGVSIGETTITATRGTETATCNVNVVYDSVTIGANKSNNVTDVNLFLDVHETETLVATVKDENWDIVNNATVNWRSSDTSIVTIDATSGKMNAVKSGHVTITAEAAGVTDTCNVNVGEAPDFTNFANAKFETSLNDSVENLKISGIEPKDDSKNNYFYIITSSNVKPELILEDNRTC